MHEVGRADEQLGLASAGEGVDARVLQEAPQDRAHADVLAEALDAGAQAADAAHDDVDRHPRARGAVEGVDDGLVDDGVDLDADPGGQAGPVVGDLLLDALDEPVAQTSGSHEQAAEAGAWGVAGELVEQGGQVLGDVAVAGQQPQVLVAAGGLGVVVAGADVAVAAQAVGLLAHDEQQLAVRLEADHAVDDVDAGALKLAGPGDIGLLIEAGLDLHDGDDLLAGLGGLDEGVHDRGVAGGAVEGLLDGQDLGVGGGLGHELLD